MISAIGISGELGIKFICSNGLIISYNKICDTTIDCTDGSDETRSLCQHSICPSDTFRCHYGACIDRKQVCDGKFNCVDKSDESNCGKYNGSCGKTEFKCNNGFCIPINNFCDGNLDCDDNSDEMDNCRSQVCPKYTYHCEHGGCTHLILLCDGINDCIDGSDESDMMCTELKNRKIGKVTKIFSCPPINSTRILTKCMSSTNEKLRCDKPLPVKTIAKYECKEFYKFSDPAYDNNSSPRIKITCQFDGTWSSKLRSCESECGILSAAANPLIIKGWVSPKGYWPWHAVLYLMEDDTLTFTCGGTLISENVVLTAAHCVWKVDVNNFMVAVGKYNSDYNVIEQYTQTRKINKVIIPHAYQDFSGNYGSDIAILYFEEAVELSNEVKPACIDWNLEYVHEQVKENSTGMIAGMGITESGNFSSDLLLTFLPVADTIKCIKSETLDFKKYITHNTFCAGFKNGTGVCNGDSGGGLLFLNKKGQWILQGITSVSPRTRGTTLCNTSKYTVFTKVASYIGWLKGNL